MDMKDSRVINAPQEKVWVALNDPAMLKQCIIGCDSLEATEPGKFAAAMSVKVGPVSAKFKGKLQLEDVQPPKSYKLKFEGQGGPAGFANGTATVSLSAESPTSTRLDYVANAMIGGKLAQIGSRLVDAAARKIADDFFSKFDALVAEPVVEAVAASVPDATAPVVAASKAAVSIWVWIVAAVIVAAALYKWCL
jgi:carbon monoxide dehydrogenase subunit G